MPSNYRPEIDGLRAVAVLLVVFYHAGFGFAPGGFIGVDVFFVISGYLITRLIYREICTTGSFDFRKFYLRRLRRILPALAVTAAATFVTAVMVFPPELLRQVAASAVASIFSASNFYFWQQSGYFDNSNDLKPLLHTWSLGVEEQFYLLWPLIMSVTITRGSSRLTQSVVLFVGAASLALSLAYIHDRSTIYYLLLFRAFELAIGAAVVFLDDKKKPSPGFDDVLCLCGLALILGSAVVFSSATIFPTYNALYPCVGAALVIISGRPMSSRLLTSWPAVSLGLISYSLYLVHWPIIVFYRYVRTAELSFFEKVGICVVSVTVAVALYRLVETPMRSEQNSLYQRRYIAIPIAGLLAAIISASAAWAQNGWTWRYSPEILALITEPPRATHSGCFLGPSQMVKDVGKWCYVASDKHAFNVLLAGDSTADDLYPGVSKALGPNAKVYSWTSSNCPPIPGFSLAERPNCKPANEKLFKQILPSNQFDLVIFAALNSVVMSNHFAPTVKEMARLGIPFVLVGEPLRFRYKPIDLVARHGRIDGLEAIFGQQLLTPCNDELGADRIVPEMFFSVQNVVCKNGLPLVSVGGHLINIDSVHYTIAGSNLVGEYLVGWLRERRMLPVASLESVASGQPR